MTTQRQNESDSSHNSPKFYFLTFSYLFQQFSQQPNRNQDLWINYDPIKKNRKNDLTNNKINLKPLQGSTQLKETLLYRDLDSKE